MAGGSIKSSEGQSAKEQIPASSNPGWPIQTRIQAQPISKPGGKK